MNVIAINGSPRKKWNTATLLSKALEGRREEVFPQDCQRAYELGARLAGKRNE